MRRNAGHIRIKLTGHALFQVLAIRVLAFLFWGLHRGLMEPIAPDVPLLATVQEILCIRFCMSLALRASLVPFTVTMGSSSVTPGSALWFVALRQAISRFHRRFATAPRILRRRLNPCPAFAWLFYDPNGDGDITDTELLFRSWNRAQNTWNAVVKIFDQSSDGVVERSLAPSVFEKGNAKEQFSHGDRGRAHLGAAE